MWGHIYERFYLSLPAGFVLEFSGLFRPAYVPRVVRPIKPFRGRFIKVFGCIRRGNI